MRLLIAYASKSGCCREMAELLARELPQCTVTVADVERECPDPADFDYAVVGGPVRLGRGHRALARYLCAVEATLVNIPHTLFLCCANPAQFENYAGRIFSQALLDSAEDVVYLGGELNPARVRGFDRLIVRMVRNAIKDSEEDEAMLPGLLPEHVRLLADRLRAKL